MRRIAVIILIFLSVLNSCYLDPLGFFGTMTGVQDRFTQSTNMPPPPDTLFANTNNYSFIHITDTHYYEGTNIHMGALQARIQSNDAFIINTGDLCNTGRESEYQGYLSHMSNMGLPFYSALGNHDLWHQGWNYFPVYLGPSVYSFTAGNIRFICLDSANASLGWEQTQWLISQLQSRSEDLCMIMMHFNLLTPSFHEAGQFADIEEVYYLMYLFETYDVDLVLMGHTHIFDDRTINGVRYVVGEELKQVSPESKQFNRITVSNNQVSVQLLNIY